MCVESAYSRLSIIISYLPERTFCANGQRPPPPPLPPPLRLYCQFYVRQANVAHIALRRRRRRQWQQFRSLLAHELRLNWKRGVEGRREGKRDMKEKGIPNSVRSGVPWVPTLNREYRGGGKAFRVSRNIRPRIVINT